MGGMKLFSIFDYRKSPLIPLYQRGRLKIVPPFSKWGAGGFGQITSSRLSWLLLAALVIPLIMGISPLQSPTEKGTEAYSAGKYDDALEAFKNAAEESPDKPEAHYNLAGAYYKKGEYDQALKEYEQAVKLDPKMSEAYYNMGDALYRMGQYDPALKAYQKADALKAKDADTEHNISVTLQKIKQKEQEQKKQGQQSMKTKGGQQDKGQGQNNQNRSAGNQNKGQGPASNQPKSGPQMSNEEVQALLDRQKKEEKSLRNYFRPGKKDEASDREAQIEQILRAAGMQVPSARMASPGAPHVDKDW